MICTLTAGRLKPGAVGAFRAAFEESARDIPDAAKRWTRVYACRDVTDENVILTFGFFDGTLDELRAIQARHRDAQLDRISPHVEDMLLDGSYEVVEEITP